MSDGGSRGSTQLSISLVRPCPDGYTGIRRAEIMLKVEPANHPFVVCMRHVIPGGDDRSDSNAYLVPLYVLEGLCLHLAGISGAGEHIRSFDLWTEGFNPVWMEQFFNEMADSEAFLCKPFSRWHEALAHLKGYALTCTFRDLNVDHAFVQLDPFPSSAGLNVADAGAAQQGQRRRSSSAPAARPSRTLRSASSAQAAGPGPDSGAPAAAPSAPASAPSAAQGASAPGGADQFQEKLAFFRRWRRLHALDFVSQASNSDFPLTELGRFILLLDDRGSNASRFGADGAAREADPYAQLQVWEELAISILRTSAGGTAVAITATPRLLEGLVLPYAEACAPVISPSAVVRELVDAKAHNEGATRQLEKGVRFAYSLSNFPLCLDLARFFCGDRSDIPDPSCLTQFDLLAAILLSTDECRLSLVPRLAAIETALTGHDTCARLLASMRAEYSGPAGRPANANDLFIRHLRNAQEALLAADRSGRSSASGATQVEAISAGRSVSSLSRHALIKATQSSTFSACVDKFQELQPTPDGADLVLKTIPEAQVVLLVLNSGDKLLQRMLILLEGSLAQAHSALATVQSAAVYLPHVLGQNACAVFVGVHEDIPESLKDFAFSAAFMADLRAFKWDKVLERAVTGPDGFTELYARTQATRYAKSVDVVQCLMNEGTAKHIFKHMHGVLGCFSARKDDDADGLSILELGERFIKFLELCERLGPEENLRNRRMAAEKLIVAFQVAAEMNMRWMTGSDFTQGPPPFYPSDGVFLVWIQRVTRQVAHVGGLREAFPSLCPPRHAPIPGSRDFLGGGGGGGGGGSGSGGDPPSKRSRPSGPASSSSSAGGSLTARGGRPASSGRSSSSTQPLAKGAKWNKVALWHPDYDHRLFLGGWLIDVKEVAKHFGISVGDKCWATIFTNRPQDRLAFCCDAAGHGGLDDPRHQPPPGFDREKVMGNSKYARRATDAESARVGWTQMKGGAKRGDRPI